MRSRTLPLLLAIGAVASTAVAPAASASGGARPSFVFTSDRDGDPEIFLRRTDGGTVQLTHNRVADFDPVWSPDGRRIAFVRSVGQGTALHVMRADGSGVRRVTTPVRTPDGTTSLDLAPAWSPDGTRLVFSSNRTGGEAEIWRICLDGSSLTRLTRTAATVSDFNPVWARGWIWFDSDRAGFFNREIYRMRPDGTSVQRMTRTADGIDDGAPDIAPDGRRVAFSSTRGNGDQDLFTMRTDGTEVRRLGSGEEIRDEVFPQWTADGTAVLYWTFTGEDRPTEAIWRIRADGSRDRQITSGRANDSSPDPYPLR